MNSKRTLVVGDIHSGVKALEQVLERANVTEKDQLIFLGDYVDGWSTAVETIDFLIDLQQRVDCIFIRGNHDELCYEWLVDGKENPTWFVHGGEATILSYEKLSASELKKHVSFYEQLSNYHIDGKNRLFLHAGFTNLKGVDFEYFSKTFYWDRTLWELALSIDPNLETNDKNYPNRLLNYKEIYIGHTPVSKLETEVIPKNAANIWNIDTGAAFKGPLTVIDVHTKEYWQSDPVYTFYPNEKGRN